MLSGLRQHVLRTSAGLCLVAEAMVETAGGGAELGVGRKSASKRLLNASTKPGR